MRYDEPAGFKFARALMWGTALIETKKAFHKGKHFLWLENKAYDLGVLSTMGIPTKNVVAVSEDPDVAMDAQERYPGFKILCGNPVEIVRREGRVFALMHFGFTRPFTKAYFDDILQMLTHGIKDGGQFFLGVPHGDEEGEQLLRSGFDLLYSRVKQSHNMDDAAIVEDYFDRSSIEEKKSLSSLMSTPKGMWEVVKKAREHTKTSMEVLEDYEKQGAGATVALRAHNFLNLIREAIHKKRFACNPKKIIFIEGAPELIKSERTYHSLLLGHTILRALPGERPTKFEERAFVAAREQKDPESMTVRYEVEDLFETFYRENNQKLGPDFPWGQYFSVDPEVVAEWRTKWLR